MTPNGYDLKVIMSHTHSGSKPTWPAFYHYSAIFGRAPASLIARTGARPPGAQLLSQNLHFFECSAIGSLHLSSYTLGHILKPSVFRCLAYLCVLCVCVCLCLCVFLSLGVYVNICMSVYLYENHYPPQCQSSRSYPSNPSEFQCSCSMAASQGPSPKLVLLPFDCTELTSLCHSWSSP